MSTYVLQMKREERDPLLRNIRSKIFGLARRRGYPEDDADDIAQDVATIFTSGREDTGTKAWDGTGEPVRAAYAIAKHVLWTRRRQDKKAAKGKAVRDEDGDSGLDEGEPPPSSQSSPEQLVREKRLLELLEVLRPVLDADLHGDTKALGVVRLWREGVTDGRELASLLGATEPEIKEAKARIKRALMRVARPYAEKAEAGLR